MYPGGRALAPTRTPSYSHLIDELPVHPVAALHLARDAVWSAAAEQSRVSEPAPYDLHAYGSAVVTLLGSLGQLTTVLIEQATRVDQEDIQQRAVSSEPVDKLNQARRHLQHLAGVLASAVNDAEQYWSAMSAMRADLDEPDTGPPQ